MKTEEILQQMLKQLIDWSGDNTAGLIMSTQKIYALLARLWEIRDYIDYVEIDDCLGEYESEKGYLMKASDFRGVIKMNKNLLVIKKAE